MRRHSGRLTCGTAKVFRAHRNSSSVLQGSTGATAYFYTGAFSGTPPTGVVTTLVSDRAYDDRTSDIRITGAAFTAQVAGIIIDLGVPQALASIRVTTVHSDQMTTKTLEYWDGSAWRAGNNGPWGFPPDAGGTVTYRTMPKLTIATPARFWKVEITNTDVSGQPSVIGYADFRIILLGNIPLDAVTI